MVDDSEVDESFVWSRTSARSENSDETLRPGSALDEGDDGTSFSSSPSRTSRAVRTLFGLGKNAAAFDMRSFAEPQHVSKAHAEAKDYIEASRRIDVGNRNLVRVRNARLPPRCKQRSVSSATTIGRDHSSKRASVVHQSTSRRLSFSVEALQKDHAVIVDEFIEQLSLSSFAYSEPDKFSTVYDKLQNELDRVLHVPLFHRPEAGKVTADIARASDVQHIVSIIISLVEHERSALVQSLASTRELMRRREGRLVSHIRKDSNQILQLRVSAGARLVSGLARCLVDERPQRRAFARWSRNTLLCSAADTKAQTDSLHVSLVAVEEESLKRQLRMRELEDAVAASARDLDREKKHTMMCWASRILRYRVRFVSTRQAQAFATWINKLKLQEVLLRRLRHWIMQRRQEALARSFRTWHHRSFGVWHQRAVEYRGVSFFIERHRSLQRALMGNALRSWQARTQCERQAHKFLRRMAFRIVHAFLQRAMRTWELHVNEVKKRFRRAHFFRLLFHRSLRRQLGVKMRRSFQAWTKAVFRRHFLYKFRARWILRTTRQALSSAVKSWQLHVRRVDFALRGFWQRRLHLSCSKSFYLWANHASKRKRIRLIMRRAISQLMVCGLERMFRKWHHSTILMLRHKVDWLEVRVSNATCELASNQISERKFHEKLIVNTSTLARAKYDVWSQRMLSRVWFNWVGTQRARRMKKNCSEDRAISLGRAKLVGRSFKAWAALYFQRLKLRLLMRHAILRLKSFTCYRAFKLWKVRILESLYHQVERKHRNFVATKLLRRHLSSKTATAFSKWAQTIESEKKSAVIMYRWFFRCIRRTKVTAFALWQSFTSASRNDERLALGISRSAHRLRTRLLFFRQSKAFSGWRSKLRLKKRFRLLVRKSVRRILRCRTALAFRTWRNATADARYDDQARQLREIAIERGRRKVRMALCGKVIRGWQLSVGCRRHSRDRCRGIILKLHDQKPSLSHAFKIWWIFCLGSRTCVFQETCIRAYETRQRQLLELCRRRYHDKLMARIVASWAQYLRARQTALKMIRRVSTRVSELALLRALGTWARASYTTKLDYDSARHRDVVICSCKRRIRKSTLSRTFACWKLIKMRHATLRQSMRRIVLSLFRRCLERAVRRWIDADIQTKSIPEVETYANALVLLAQRSRAHLALRRVFRAWLRLHTSHGGARRFAQQLAASKKRCALSSAFACWRTWHSWNFRLGFILRRAGRRNSESRTFVAFCRWITFILKQRRKNPVDFSRMSVCQRVQFKTCSTESRGISEGEFVPLVRSYMTANSCTLRLPLWPALMQLEAKRSIAIKHVWRFMHLRVSHAIAAESFSIWRRTIHAMLRVALHQEVVNAARYAMTIESRRLRERELLATRYNKRRATNWSFTAWRTASTFSIRQKANVQHRKRLRARTYARRVMFDWRRVVSARGLARRILVYVLLALRRNVTRRSFLKWRFFSDRVKCCIVKRRDVLRLRRRRSARIIASAFTAWHWRSRGIRFAKRLLSRLIRRNSHQRTTTGFAIWRNYLFETRRRDRLTYRIKRRFVRCMKLRALHMWINYARTHQLRREVAFRTLRFWLQRKKMPAFLAWKRFVFVLQKQADVTARQNQLIERVRQRILQQFSFRAFNTWMYNSQSRKRLRKLVLHAMRRFQRNNKAPAFRTWFLATEQSRRMEAKRHWQKRSIDRVRRCMMHTTLTRALNSWFSYVNERQLARRTVGRLIRRIMQSRARIMFVSWLRYIGFAQRHEAVQANQAGIMSRVIRRLRHTSIAHTSAHAFTSWQLLAKRGKHLHALLRKVCHKLKNVALSRAFFTLTSQVRELHRCRGILNRVLGKLCCESAAIAFSSWKHFVGLSQSAEASERRRAIVLSHARRRAAIKNSLRVFKAWVKSSRDRRLARRRLMRALKASQERKAVAAWQAWRQNTEHLRHLATILSVRSTACCMMISVRARYKAQFSHFLRATIFRSWRYLAILKELSHAGAISSRGAARHMLRILEREALRLIRKGFDKFIQFVDVERVKEEALEQESRRRIERRQKAVFAIQLLNVKVVRKFYVAWLDNHKQSRIHRKLQLYTVKVRLNQRIATVLVKWREFVHAMKWFKRWMVRMVKHRNRTLMGVSLRAWCLICRQDNCTIQSAMSHLELDSANSPQSSGSLLFKQNPSNRSDQWKGTHECLHQGDRTPQRQMSSTSSVSSADHARWPQLPQATSHESWNTSQVQDLSRHPRHLYDIVGSECFRNVDHD